MPNKLSEKQVIEDYKAKNILMLSEYINTKTKNSLKCCVCNHRWESAYGNLRSGNGCPKCGILKRSNSQRHSHDFVKSQYKSANITLLSKYINADSRNHLKCEVCQHKWYGRYGHFQQGKRCPKCNGSLKHTQSFVKEAYKEGNITLLSKYSRAISKNKLSCDICNHKWEGRYNDFQQGHGCPSCSKHGFKSNEPAFVYFLRLKLNSKEYFKIGVCHTNRLDRRIKEIHPDIEVVGLVSFDHGYKALQYEKYLHRKFKKHKVNLKYVVRGGYTEFFNKNVLNMDLRFTGQIQLPFD